jgi:hypothetical protein
MDPFLISLPLTDSALQLAPRWGELGAPAQQIALALCGLVPLALVLWLYRHELRLVSRAAALGLLLLRVAVIALLWFIVCLQPVLTATSTREVPTRVVVAVDLSGSMTATDPDRPAADKLRLARALRLPIRGERVAPELLDDWIRQYARAGKGATKSALRWVKPGEAPEEGKRRQLSRQRRTLHDAICAAVDGLTRAQIVRRLLAADGGKLLQDLGASHQVGIVGFDRKARDLTAQSLDERGDPLAKPSRPTGDEAVTDLAGPLEQGLNPARQAQGRLIGVVLLSDGRHNAGSAPARSAEQLGKRKVPVLPVVVGTPFPRSRVSITDVRAPLAASARNVDVTVRVRFKVSGLTRQKILVKLERAEQPAGRLKDPEPFTIEHDGRDQYYERTFSVVMDPDGKPLQTFIVRVVPQTRPRTGNLSHEVVIKMDDTQPKVLLVDGEARWEYHYLANALGRDPSLLLEPVVFELPLRDPTISDEKLRSMKNPRRHLPAGPEALGGYQCIILGDVSPEQLPLPDRRRLEAFVARHGGTLVLVAGKQAMPLAYAGLPPGVTEGGDDPLLKLLPVERPRVVKPEEGFPVALTREGRSTPFMQMESEPGESLRRWQEFPRHYWGVVGRAKPAATTLAYFHDPAEPVPLTDRARREWENKQSRESALIVRQNYGRGQVLFIGLDSTWRWRYRVGDTYHHRFWGQVVRWAASDYVGFGAERPVYQEGQDVTVRLNLESRAAADVPPAGRLKARVLRAAEAGGREKLTALVPLTGGGGLRVLQGRVRGLEPGRYRLELEGADAKLAARLKEKPPAPFLVTPRDNREMDRLETDEDLLRDLAARSGAGTVVYTPANTGEVVERLRRRNVLRIERRERALWQEWLTLVVFLGLVTAEWVGRKWAGLP